MISWRCGLSPGKNPPNLCSWEAVPKVLWKKTPEISLVKRESSGKIELNEIPQCLVKKFNNFHLWIHLRHLRRGDYSMTQWFPKSTDYKNSISWSSHYHLLQLELSRVTWGMLLLGSGLSVLYRAHPCMECSFGISNFLGETSNISHSLVFLYFFALFI